MENFNRQEYNNNIKQLLNSEGIDVSSFGRLTDKELLTDENKLKVANVLIKQDYRVSKKLINEVRNGISEFRYSLEIRILEKILLEQKLYSRLSLEKKEFYDNAITLGREHLNNQEYGEAYDCYTAGKYVTNHPIFDYYIGKTFYKNGNYRDAKKYLYSYLRYGGEKETKTMLYLGKIYERKRDYEKAISFYEKSNKINANLENYNHCVIEYSHLKDKLPEEKVKRKK